MAHEDLPQTTTAQTSSQVASNLVSAALETAPAPEDIPADGIPDYVDPLAGVEPAEAVPAPAAPAADQPPLEPAAEPAVEDVPIELADNVYNELLMQGINIGVRKSELPVEMHASYDKMLVGVVTQAQQIHDERERAAKVLEQVQGFAERLKNDPSQVLLTLALENKEAFTGAVEQFERMQSDPEYEALVRRETVAKAQMGAAKRQMAQAQTQALNQKAQQVRALTEMHARVLGVDFDIADSVVAARVTQTQGAITPADIEAAVRSIAPKAPAVRTPAAQATHAQAQPAQGVQTPAPGETPPEPVPADTSHVRSPLRGLIKNAARRVDAGFRGG